jgi:RNA polymerase sigma factor (sigma-70 family)
MELSVETLVEQAKGGDKQALESLIRSIQDRIYNLAVRMLFFPADAEDATQEILIKVITHLDRFQGESAFTTWVYSIASNHLLTTRKRRAETRDWSFEEYGNLVDRDVAAAAGAPPDAEQLLIVQEIAINCMQGMLQCFDRDLRIAFILGEILEVSGEDAAYILTITPAAFRKRLSRARTLLRSFMKNKCGLVNPEAPCRCSAHVSRAVAAGLTEPSKLVFAGHACRKPMDGDVFNTSYAMAGLERTAALFRSHPEYAAPGAFVEKLKQMVEAGKFELFAHNC